jgi:hypothetical protein
MRHAVYFGHAMQVSAQLLVVAVVVAASADAHGLRVRIRARGQIESEAYRSRGHVVVRGTLRDSRHKPVRDASLSVAIQPAIGDIAEDDDNLAVSATTSSHGRFEAKFKVPASLAALTSWRLDISFSGNTEVSRATLQRTVDIAKPQARLEIEVKPALLTTDMRSLEVAVFASMLDLPLTGRAVKIRIDDQPRAVVQTGADGWAVHEIATAALMPVGQHTLSLELPESDDHNSAVGTALVEVRAATAVTLKLLKGTVTKPCKAREVCFEGKVAMIDPVAGEEACAGATVTLHANKMRLFSRVADVDGRFIARLKGESLRTMFGTGDIGLVVEAQAPLAYSEPGWSNVLVVRAPLPEALSEWFYFALLGLIAAGLLGRRWLERWRERGLARELAEVSAGLPIHSVRRVGSGGLEARRLRGVVIDGETGKPVAARVTLTPADGGTEVAEQFAGAGAFDLDAIDDGGWLLQVEVAEHETLKLQIKVPHDGTYDGCELLPRSHRALVRIAFADSVREQTGRAVNWLHETPQVAETRWMKAARRGHAEIRAAVAVVDRAVYGRPTTHREVDQARSELATAEEKSR